MTLDEARAHEEERSPDSRGVGPVAALRATRAEKITAREALELLQARNLKPATLEGYRQDLERLGWLDRRLASITESVLLAAFDKRKGKHTSTARMLRGFRSVWNAARNKHRNLPPCPTRALREVRRDGHRRRKRVIDDANMSAWRKAGGRSGAPTCATSCCSCSIQVVASPNRGRLRPPTLICGPVASSDRTREQTRSRPAAHPTVEESSRAGSKRRLGRYFPQAISGSLIRGVDAAAWSYHDLRRGYVTAAHRLGIDDQVWALTNPRASKGDAHAGYVRDAGYATP
jgi:hypothetical protein